MYFGTLSDLFYHNKDWISKLPKIKQLAISKPVILRIINKYYQFKIASQKLIELKNENKKSPSKKNNEILKNNLLFFNKRPNSFNKRNFYSYKRSQSLKKARSENYNLVNFPKISINKTLKKSSAKSRMTTNIHLYKNITEIYNKNMNKDFMKNIMFDKIKSTKINNKNNQENSDSSDSKFSYRIKLKKYKSEIKKVLFSSANFLLNQKTKEIPFSRNRNFYDINKENLSSDKTHNYLNKISSKKSFKLKINSLLKNELTDESILNISRNLKETKKFAINLSNIKLETKDKNNNKKHSF